MTVDPWAIDASGGLPSYSGGELRLSTVTPFVAGTGTSLGVRSGVRLSGSGTDLLVQAQTSPNMTVKVNPGVLVVQGSISGTQGAYTYTLDATTNVTISAAHATLDRTDLIVIRVRDANVDTSGGRDGAPIVITGTAGGGVPSLPTDATYFLLAQISVVHAVSSITSGAITDKRQYTAALGGVIPCDSNTQPSAGSVAPHQLAYRTDLGVFQAVQSSAWRYATPYRQVTVVGSAVGSITFSGFPTGLRNITVKWTARGTNATEVIGVLIRVNNDSTGAYFGTYMQEQNATVTNVSNSGGTSQQVGVMCAASAGANAFSVGQIDIGGIGSASRKMNATFRSHCWSTQANSYHTTGGFMYNAVGPYTSFVFLPATGNFDVGTEFYFEGWD